MRWPPGVVYLAVIPMSCLTMAKSTMMLVLSCQFTQEARIWHVVDDPASIVCAAVANGGVQDGVAGVGRERDRLHAAVGYLPHHHAGGATHCLLIVYQCLHVNVIVFTQLWGTYHTIMRAGPHTCTGVSTSTLLSSRSCGVPATPSCGRGHTLSTRSVPVCLRQRDCLHAAVGHLPHHHAGGAGGRTPLAPGVPVHTLPHPPHSVPVHTLPYQPHSVPVHAMHSSCGASTTPSCGRGREPHTACS
jgi:hypothetical protein